MTIRSRAIWMLILANVFWGLSFPLIKAIELANARIVPDAGGAFITLYTIAPRFFLGLVVLAVWLRRGLLLGTAGEWKRGALIGVLGVAGMYAQNDGLRFTHASTSAFLTQFYAIMIPIWVAVRHGTRPPAIVWFCCALVLAGVAILGGVGVGDFHLGRGEIETLVCSVFFMGQILCVERSGTLGDRPVQLTVAIFVVMGALSGLGAVVAAPQFSALVKPWTDPGWLALVIPIALFSTVGAFLLMMSWQPKITSTEAGIVYCTEPLFGAGFALFLPVMLSRWSGIDYPNEQFTTRLIAGGILITGANLLIQYLPQRSSGGR